MTLFAKKIALFMFGLALFAFGLETVVDAGLRKSPACKEWSDLFNSRINADLLVQGSSRAVVHISPRVLDSALQLNSYNLGINGHNFLLQDYRFKMYLQHNKKPRYIIQSLDMKTLDRRKDLFEPEQFMPYLKDPLIQESTCYYEGFGHLDYLVPAAKYRVSSGVVYTGLKRLVKPGAFNKYKGFEAQDKRWDDSFVRFKKENPAGVAAKVDPLTLKLFTDFAAYCKANNIVLVLVYSPEYVEAQHLITNRAEIFDIFKGIASKNGAAFLDYSDSYISRDTRYFYNSQHLNAAGVARFNEILAADLKPLLAR